MVTVSSLRMNDQQQVLRPLVNSSIDQFLADCVSAAVPESFNVVNVLDLLMIYQMLKSAPN